MKILLIIICAFTFSLSVTDAAFADRLAAGISEEKARKVVSKSAEEEIGEITNVQDKKGLYEISVKTPSGLMKKIYVDAVTGQVIKKMPVSVQDATKVAIEKVPGKVLKVKFKVDEYEVYIKSTEGKVKEVYVDANSGMIKKIKSEHWPLEKIYD